jgi:hypothetical protein
MVRRRSDTQTTAPSASSPVSNPPPKAVEAARPPAGETTLPAVTGTKRPESDDVNEAWGFFPPGSGEPEPKLADAADLDGPGFELELSIGPNTYAPVKYNTFTVGPVRVKIQPGESELLRDTYARAVRTASMLYELEFAASLRRYLADLRRVAAAANAAAGGRG